MLITFCLRYFQIILQSKSFFYLLPLESRIIKCPYFFGIGRELERNERMDLYRKVSYCLYGASLDGYLFNGRLK
jgi:hypothetical protein